MSDWLAGVAIVVLWLGWTSLRVTEGPPVLGLAFANQWVQVTAGFFYYGLTRRTSPQVGYVDCRPMVMVGLATVLILALAVSIGMRFMSRTTTSRQVLTSAVGSSSRLLGFYLIIVALDGLLQVWAWNVPQITQGLLALGYFRYALFYILLRRFALPRFHWLQFTVLVLLELVLSSTGYFAGFREPLVLATLVMLEVYNPRRMAHIFTIGLIGSLALVAGLIWTGVKKEYRFAYKSGVASSTWQRMQLIGNLSSNWLGQGEREWGATLDDLVDRIWQVYYPELALERVPSTVPHTNGAIIGEALVHIVMPRLLFPNKPELTNDSEKVRAFSGVWVAGEAQGASIAFGYAAESYVDFGIPWMFLPVFLYGLWIGVLYTLLMNNIRHRELALAVTCTIMWISLYSFERSWAMTLGTSVTLAVFLGGAAVVLDRTALRSSNLRLPTPARGLPVVRL